MLNNKLKKGALEIHRKETEAYNASCSLMTKECDTLYNVRRSSIYLIETIERVVNSIAKTPKEFSIKFGEIHNEISEFRSTEEYATEAYDNAVKEGINIGAVASMGVGVAAMAPSALMSVATTFGTASTGTAISALSGAAAQKAAVAWIGRTFAGFMVKSGAGLAVGNAFLALIGPIGWGLTAVSTSYSLLSVASKNKKIANEAIDEAKEIRKMRESFDEITEKIKDLKRRTAILRDDLRSQKERIISFTNADYSQLAEEDRDFLVAMVENTYSLSALLNESVAAEE